MINQRVWRSSPGADSEKLTKNLPKGTSVEVVAHIHSHTEGGTNPLEFSNETVKGGDRKLFNLFPDAKLLLCDNA